MKIVISSGGTLGHLMPIFPVVKKLKELDYEVILYTSRKLDFDKDVFDKIEDFEAYGLSKNIYNSIYKNLCCYRKIKKSIKKEKPDIVIGMGGYISGLTILAASKLHIKTLIHEQNSVLGTANKIVLNKVNYIIYSNESLKLNKDNSIFLPNPRSEVAAYYSKIYKKKKNQILIVSGSLGAKTLNEIGLNLSRNFKEYNFILITGKRYFDGYKKYQKDNLKIFPKTKNLIKRICESSIVITRAGATTISEILGSSTVGIYIPSPNVTKNHQEKNTMMIKEKTLGLVINEKEIKNYNIDIEFKKVLKDYDIYQKNLKRLDFNNVIKEYINIIEGLISKN